MYTKQTRNFYL